MSFRSWGPLACLSLAFAGLIAGSACDPCAHCAGGGGTPTPTPAPNACLPSSSIAVLIQGTNATAYVPKGNWDSEETGVNVVPIESSAGIGQAPSAPQAAASPALISTPNVVNSCSSNSKTGTTVCTANNTDVYLISGTTLDSTLNSGSDSEEEFSGGSCNNCGVVVDSTTNKALIGIGLQSAGPGGYQFLDLAGSSFENPFGAGTDISEDISIDPIRKLILSPNEGNNYQIVDISGASPAIFNNAVGGQGEFDSAGEDCATGIALATAEFTGNLFIADLKQATFTPGNPGTWTAPSQVQNFPEFENLEAGTCGIAIAPGKHFGIVTGEFGGNLEGVIQLPSTSGTGVPAVVDWVVFTVPNDPTDREWVEGFDPHTVTAYVSPNSKKALAVLGNDINSYLAVVDLEALINAPRTGHTVNNPLPAGAVTFVAQQ